MRKIVLVICSVSLLWLAISCNDDEAAYFTVYSFILAGQKDGNSTLYTDVVPDDTLKIPGFPDNLSMTKPLDFDNDGAMDVELYYSLSNPYMLGSGGSSLTIIPLDDNEVCTSDAEPTWADAIIFSDTINKSDKWSDSTALIYSYSWQVNGLYTSKGYFNNDDDIYIGIKLNKKGYSAYGWLSVNRAILKGYAATVPYGLE